MKWFKTSVLTVVLVVLGVRKGLIWPHRFDMFSPVIEEMGLLIILCHRDFILTFYLENLPVVGVFPVVRQMGTPNTRGLGYLIINPKGWIQLF